MQSSAAISKESLPSDRLLHSDCFFVMKSENNTSQTPLEGDEIAIQLRSGSTILLWRHLNTSVA